MCIRDSDSPGGLSAFCRALQFPESAVLFPRYGGRNSPADRVDLLFLRRHDTVSPAFHLHAVYNGYER